jgi:hypothetical protein
MESADSEAATVTVTLLPAGGSKSSQVQVQVSLASPAWPLRRDCSPKLRLSDSDENGVQAQLGKWCSLSASGLTLAASETLAELLDLK